MKIELIIPEATLNKYVNEERRSRFAAAQMKKAETDAVAEQVKMAMLAGIRFTWPAKIKFTWHLKNFKTDPDNVSFTKKYILDGMEQCGFLPNDSLKYILGFMDDFVIDGIGVVEIEEIHD